MFCCMIRGPPATTRTYSPLPSPAFFRSAVIALISRRVVGWSMSPNMTAQLVTDALIISIWRRGKPDALLHHSDQGSQYTSEQFQRLMADNGVKIGRAHV